ncbi:GtrA family protein [Streptomyces sp. SCUT-3]|uniref:GtrA family protein n=1 Tax=Streptomyces sp. SCUT-3 TaxID=2684469 RepID=UPI0015FC2ABF|nr:MULTISPECIES: GtrA family protein [unclassified Streptomyces]MCZ2523433.1 GtrA family protein [Streptomyces sp. HB2AG]QMV23218.1 GtrA family protein [Streptomyces sp. SCUT-3]
MAAGRPRRGARGGAGRPGARGEVLGFAAAGLAAYLTDVALFVWLRGPLGTDPLTAKALSFVGGCTVAFLGNRLGPYRGRRADGAARQYALFFAVNAAGAAVQLGCIAVSHHLLGFTGARADLVSGSVVGMALATALRFWGTRSLVFRPAPAPADAAGPASP